MSSIVLSAHVVKPTWGTKRKFAIQKAEHENKSHESKPSPRKTPNPHIHMEHCVHRENHFSEENNGRAANYLGETNPKQTSTFFHSKTVLLRNTLIVQNQVVYKFSSCTTDDDRTVKNVLVFKILVTFSLL